MSLSFLVPGCPAPDFGAVREWLPDGAVLEPSSLQLGTEGAIGVAVLPEVSTRGVPVYWTELVGLEARARPLSSEADIELALSIAVHCAEDHDLDVDDGTDARPPALALKRWEARARRERALTDTLALMERIAEETAWVAGPRRRVRAGPKMIHHASGDPARLLAWMRSVQWPGEPPPHEPLPRPAADDESATMVTLAPGVRTLIPAADLVALAGEPPYAVPRPMVVRTLGKRAARFDEDRHLIEALDELVWNGLRKAVAPHRIGDPGRWRTPDLEGAGPLLPVLRSPIWPLRQVALCWPLSPRGDSGPLVTIVRDTPRALVPVDSNDPAARDRGRALESAIRFLETRLPPWDVERAPDGRIQALVLVDAYASEAVLSPDRMRAAQLRMEARALLAAVPVRGIVRIEDAFPDDADEVKALAAWADAVFKDATAHPTMTPLTPDLLVVVDGKVQGPVDPFLVDESISDDGSMDLPALVIEPMEITEERPVVVTPEPRYRLEPWKAALASALLPGLGQWWLGARGAAASYLIAAILLAGGLGVVQAVAAWDAYRRAARG